MDGVEGERTCDECSHNFVSNRVKESKSVKLYNNQMYIYWFGIHFELKVIEHCLVSIIKVKSAKQISLVLLCRVGVFV